VHGARQALMPSQLFVPTGTMETFVVPPHQPGTLEVWIEGGRGANGARLTATIRSIGGVGGRFHGTLNLPAGTTLHVIAGYGATDALPDFHQQAGFGPAFGGQGGNGGSPDAGGGGCASEVRSSPDIGDRILVAGGGGGGPALRGLNTRRGGAGGAANNNGSSGIGAYAGGGGTLSAGGAGGTGEAGNG